MTLMLKRQCPFCGCGSSLVCRCVADDPWDGGGRVARIEITFDGATAPSSATGFDWDINTLTNPTAADPGGGHTGNAIVIQPDHAGYIVNGQMPDTIVSTCLLRGSASTGALPLDPPRELDPAVCVPFYGGREILIATSRPPDFDFAPDCFAYIQCAFPTSFFSSARRIDHRNSYFATVDANHWPYALADTGGIVPRYHVAEWFTQLSAFDDGDDQGLELIVYGVSHQAYSDDQVYDSTYPREELATGCNREATLIRTEYVVFRGRLVLGVDVTEEELAAFPCGREAWTFTNLLTAGITTGDTRFGLTSGGTATLRLGDCAFWLADAHKQYRLQMSVGQHTLDPDATTPLGVSCDDHEDIDITMDRYFCADTEIVAGIGPVAVWYGEDDHYKAKLVARPGEATPAIGTGTLALNLGGNGYALATLTVQRKADYESATAAELSTTPTYIKFQSAIYPEEVSPPEHAEDVPRYWPVDAHPPDLRCPVPGELSVTQASFAYHGLTLTKTGDVQPFVPLACQDGECPPTLKVAWRGAEVRLLATTDATPAGYYDAILTYDTAQRFYCVWSGSSLYASSITLRVSNEEHKFDGFDSGLDIGTVIRPSWRIHIVQTIPPAVIVARFLVDIDPEAACCPPTGVYADGTCSAVGDLCDDPSLWPCKVKYVVTLTSETVDLAPLEGGTAYDLDWDGTAWTYISGTGNITLSVGAPCVVVSIDAGTFTCHGGDGGELPTGTKTLTDGVDETTSITANVACVVVDTSPLPCVAICDTQQLLDSTDQSVYVEFFGGTTLPPGNYVVKYLGGAYIYNVNALHDIDSPFWKFDSKITDSAGSTIVEMGCGDGYTGTTGLARLAEVEAENEGAEWTFTLSASAVLRLYINDSVVNDNDPPTPGEYRPRFRVCSVLDDDGLMMEMRPAARAAPAFDGPAKWSELHTFAAAYAGDESAAREWLDAYAASLPSWGCACRRHWRAWVAANPPDFTDLLAWTWAAHEAVNLRLGKTGITLDAARALYA